MSRNITKPQLALAVAKGKRIELEQILDDIRGREVPGIINVVFSRIQELKKEIDEIEGNIPKYIESQHKGLIS